MSLLHSVMDIERFAVVAAQELGAPGAEATQRQVNHLVASMPKMTLTLAEATTVLERMQLPTCGLPQSSIQSLKLAIARSLSSVDCRNRPSGGHGICQMHLSFFNYRTKSDWSVLMNESAAVEARMWIVVQRALTINLL